MTSMDVRGTRSDFEEKKVQVENRDTLPKFNIAPEKRWLENYFPFGMIIFQGLC